MKEINLKPCPFCGGNRVKYLESIYYSTPIGLRCGKCKAEFQFYDKKENTITDKKKITDKFNKRQS